VVLLFLVLQRNMGIGAMQVLTCLVLSLLTYGAVYVAFSYLPRRAVSQPESA